MSVETLSKTCGFEFCQHPPHDAFGLCELHSARREHILRGMRFRIPCEKCGEETATTVLGTCSWCSRTAPCIECGTPRGKTAKTGLCGDCHRRKTTINFKECRICDRRLGKDNKSGLCKPCSNRVRHGSLKDVLV